LEATEKHLAAATKRSTAVSAGASTATTTAPSGTTVALGAAVFVFVKFVIHYFSFVVNLTITIYRYRTFVKG